MSTLLEEIQAYQKQFRQKAPEEKQRLMAQATAELAASDGAKGLTVGDEAPRFTLPNASGQSVSLEDLLQNGPVIVTFYRGGWCPYCNLELRAYQRELGKIEANGATLVAISPETPDHSLSTQEKNDLAFQVLSDVENVVARQFDLVFNMPDYLIDVYKASGLDVARHNGNEDWQLPKPATFIIQPSGKISFADVPDDYTKRTDPSAVIKLL
ncbi:MULTISPECIES: peroxiredoxin-like family protein [Exiguobacterium]|uniref:peroxiredoxin-like family protein n=1 Tax=Exiguobacterium TaxID=33986 RepID=UPI001BE5D1CB|nr:MULTISPECIES: peroxiredoxin-like family protein [Exiguobacterium]MCT4791232.1 AhpC/TSA family protein [Exiguobacterium artemiae]